MTRAIRPETLALDAVIQETVHQAARDSACDDRLIFLGNRQPSFPAAVVIDPVLEPVDKLVWMVIRFAVCDTGGNIVFPTYAAIGRMANVSSRQTIARAIAILRATRWLTLCARVRQDSERFRGHVYALHEEPLPLADACHLDADYLDFLDKASAHGHARVRAVAQGVLESIHAECQAGGEIGVPQPLAQRRERSHAAGEPRRFFSFNQPVGKRLRSGVTPDREGGVHHDQNSNTVGDHVQNLHAQKLNRGRSSRDNHKGSTTESSKFKLTGEDAEPLVYPARFGRNMRDIAARCLSKLAPEQRQPILDELEGRFRAEAMGMTPVYDEISFLHALCKRMTQGTFQPKLGVKVRDRRCERKKAGSEHPLPNPATETEAERKRRMVAGRVWIAEIRQKIGLPPPTKNQCVRDES